MQTLSSLCCISTSASPVAVTDDPFSQMVVLDYYDGPVGGLLKCGPCSAEYYFYLLDWDKMHAVRIFAVAPLPQSSLEDVLNLFQAIPDRRVWVPPWPVEEQQLESYDKRIQDVTNRAAAPTLAMAWSVRTEKTLAMRGIDSSAMPHLIPWFDHQPQPNALDWFSYLGLVKS